MNLENEIDFVKYISQKKNLFFKLHHQSASAGRKIVRFGNFEKSVYVKHMM